MQVNPKYINLLREPFGVLIKEYEVNKEKIYPFIRKSNKIITVGDTTTEKFVEFGYVPDLSIIDNKEKRIMKCKIIEFEVDKIITCENRPGEINMQVIDLIKKLTTMKFNKIQIIIEGEEDLVALPLFMYSPDKWTIFYGQPNEGLVVVEINNTIRKRAKSIFNKVFSH
ncbi:MAG: GTP-dependent dephospho-CoA kinase family protein [Thermoproteota archaeon]|nr:GTP-dependent dephospho-CoA kinase family protein [Thermoproteota archaeon]